MAKSSRKPDQSSRHGKIPDGWMKQNLQLPEKLGKEFRDEAGGKQHGGVKLLGTAAIAFIMALKPEERLILMKYVQANTWGDPNQLDRDGVKRLLFKLISEEEDEQQPEKEKGEPVWYVDKIVDPELSPEPGKKWSDRHADEKDERKKGG